MLRKVAPLSLVCLALVGGLFINATNHEVSRSERAVREAEALIKKDKFEEALVILLDEDKRLPHQIAIDALIKKTFLSYCEFEIKAGDDAVERNALDVEAYMREARGYSYLGDNLRAMEVLTEGTMENPGSISLWMTIAAMEMKAGRDAEAVSVWSEVLRLNSRFGVAHNNLAYLLVKSNARGVRDLQSALMHAKEAVALEPRNADFIDTLAEVLDQMGDRAHALGLMQQAVALAPQEPAFRSHLKRIEMATARAP